MDSSLVRQLRERHPSMRIVVVTDVDSFASVILALRAGADDYLAKPVGEGELIDALLGRAPILPPVPRPCSPHLLGARDAGPRAMRPQRERDGAAPAHASTYCSAS